MIVTVSFWNRWVPPRMEETADGTKALYFGVGRLTWNTPVKVSNSGSDETYD